MKRTILIVIAVLVAAATLFIGIPASAMSDTMADRTGYTRSESDLRAGMRKLWEDHIVYTRGYIVSVLAGLDDAGKVAERLLKNQDDIGNAIKPVYGEEAGKKLAALLRDHILIAADIVAAAKAGNNDGVAAGQKRWLANADDIAGFLAGANPNWKPQDLKNMLYKHLSLTTTEVTARLRKDWAGDIAAYDEGHDHMLMFADMLS